MSAGQCLFHEHSPVLEISLQDFVQSIVKDVTQQQTWIGLKRSDDTWKWVGGSAANEDLL